MLHSLSHDLIDTCLPLSVIKQTNPRHDQPTKTYNQIKSADHQIRPELFRLPRQVHLQSSQSIVDYVPSGLNYRTIRKKQWLTDLLSRLV